MLSTHSVNPQPGGEKNQYIWKRPDETQRHYNG